MITKYWDYKKDEFSDRPASLVIGFIENVSFLDNCPDLIDIGCGTGNMIKYLNENGHMAYGVTFQPLEVQVARSKGNDFTVIGDMHDLPWPDNHFDGFLMWDSLEHSVAPLVALSEAKRVVKDGGRGLIFIPQQSWIECNYHIIVPNIRQMKHLFNLVGLKLVEIVDMGDEQAVYKVEVIK